MHASLKKAMTWSTYVAWLKVNHPEHCLSVCSSSSGHANHASPVTEDHTSDNDVLSDILVLPKPKEKSGWKRKAGINQKTVCLTDDDVFDGLRAKDKEKKENELKRLKENYLVRKKKLRRRNSKKRKRS